MTAAPRVGIGLPVRNGARYLAPTLESLLAQDFGDFELLISDNASTDATEEVARDVAARDPRVRYERVPADIGAAGNYNRVFQRTRGSLFKWAPHDDLYPTDYLRSCVAEIDTSSSTPVLVYPPTTLIDEDGTPLGSYADNLDLRSPDPRVRLRAFAQQFNLCNPVLGVIRRDALERTRLIDAFVSSDVVLLAELALIGELHEVPTTTFYRRIHDGASRAAGRSFDDVAQWFGPGNERRSVLHPRHRVFGEILRSIGRADMSRGERIRAQAGFSRAWWERRVRVEGGRIKRRVREARERRRVPEAVSPPG